MGNARLIQNGLIDAATVARIGYEALMKGKTVVTPGLQNKLGTLAPRFLPRRLLPPIVRYLQKDTDA